MSHTKMFIKETADICALINSDVVEELATRLAQIRVQKGRVFFMGVGGSSANCSHAVNDFRKLCAIECYSVTDNVSELTARTNDEGWDSVFESWLKVSNLNSSDAVFVLSVGGGNVEKNISVNLVNGIIHAKSVGAKIFGVVGKDDGYTAKVADCVVVIPVVNVQRITPHAEAFQAVVWHCLVSNPKLQLVSTKW